jgi:hypothetical protein
MTHANPEDDSDAPTTLVRSGTPLAEDLRKVALEHAPPAASAPAADGSPEDLSSAATQAPAAPRAATAHLSAHGHTSHGHTSHGHTSHGHDAHGHGAHEPAPEPPVVVLPGRPADWTVVIAFVLITLGIPLLGALGLLGRTVPADAPAPAGTTLSPHGVAGPSEMPAIPPQ